MKTKQVWMISAIILAVLNLVLLFLFTQRPAQAPLANMPGRREGLKEIISEKLSLDQEQKSRYDDLALAHRQTLNRIDKKQKDLLEVYFESLQNNEPDSANERLLTEVAFLEKEKIVVTYQHFEELKGLLDESKNAEFDVVIDDILKVLIGEEKKPRPPRGK